VASVSLRDLHDKGGEVLVVTRDGPPGGRVATAPATLPRERLATVTPWRENRPKIALGLLSANLTE
jgi:hypothetical protein